MLQILDNVANMDCLPMVGCIAHEKNLTKKIVNCDLVIRAHFLADSLNNNFNARKIKTKNLRKNAKL